VLWLEQRKGIHQDAFFMVLSTSMANKTIKAH
jgi:hypothetical protein